MNQPARNVRNFPPAIVTLAAAALLLAPLRAQAPSPWVDLVPTGGVNPAAVSAMGKLVLYRDGEFLRVFSAVTGKWHAQSLSYGTAPVLRRDILLIPESDRWTAFSAYRGVFVPLFVNLAATGILTNESVACVVDGNLLHTFSAFTGEWHTRSMPPAWVTIAIGPRMVVIGDRQSIACTGASAFDAYTGQWHDLPAQPRRLQGVVNMSGTCALLDFVDYFQGVSMQRPGFVQIANPFGGSQTYVAAQDSDFVAARGKFFSGLNGGFHLAPPTTSVGTFVQYGMVGICSTVGQEFACGIAGNAWTALPAGALLGPTADAVALYSLGGQTLAFSGVRDTVSAVNGTLGTWPAAQFDRTGSVACFVDTVTGVPMVFSALTGQWHAAPGNAMSVLPVISRTAALLQTTDGVAAFSARSGAFVPWVGSPLARHADRGGDVVATTDGSTLAVFDARVDRWLASPSTDQGPRIGKSVLVAVDAVNALGFGARSGRLDVLPLPEPALATVAVDDVAFVRTANHVFAFRSLGDDVPWFAFPEDDLACGIGTTLRRQTRLSAGDAAIVGIAPRAAVPTPLPPYGDLWLDLDLAASITFVVGAPGEERFVQTLPIPDIAVLKNTEWWLQSLTLPTVGAPYLGEPATVRVL